MGKIAPPDKPLVRGNIFTCYAANMARFLQAIYPECNLKQIEKFVFDYTSTHCQELYRRYENARVNGENLDIPRPKEEMLWPTIQLAEYSSDVDKNHKHAYGCQTFYSQVSALDVINQTRDKIISPFGSAYETTDICSSFLKGMIGTKTKLRKKEKKLMLEAKKSGDKTAETFHNNNQATIKINMNSIIGGMGSSYCFLSNMANFNSVTSISRFFVMNAYAHAERFLEGNFYFRNEEQVINHVINCIKCGPDEQHVAEVVTKYNFYVPTADEVYSFLVDNLHRYMLATEHPLLKKLVDALTVGQRCFIYYMSNLKHLIMKNESYFRPWIDDFFSEVNVVYDDKVEPSMLYDLDGDLVIVLSTVYHDIMPKNDAGNSISAYDTVTSYPEIAKRLVCIGKHMQQKLDAIEEIFDLFTNHAVGISYVAEHKFMFRNTVILSDTDSIIFTTKSWVQWYNGSLKMQASAFAINSLVVYWLAKANASILAQLSVNFGALDKDIYGMNMKNEFMMPILMLTPLKKHYTSFLKIQEGVFYSQQRLDIKGVGLKGSNFGQLTLNYVQWFIHTLLDDIYDHGSISARKYIVYALQFERTIYDSLYMGETKFLTVDPVKNKEEYAESERSIYFNYLFWEEVFGDKYGNIAIPTKCYVLPLKGVNTYNYTHYLEENFPDIAVGLKRFTSKYSKEINRIPINPITNRIPEELRIVSNFRAVIYSNIKPLYLVLNSLGIVDGSLKKQNRLFSDIYGWIELSDEDKANIANITGAE